MVVRDVDNMCFARDTESPENVQQGSLARFGRRQEVDIQRLEYFTITHLNI
jgi:hypothetical protein